MKKLDITKQEVMDILSNPKLSLQEMADAIGVKSKWYICRKRKALGLPKKYPGGLDRPLTNRERKAKYNAKRKAIGWKYLYQISE